MEGWLLSLDALIALLHGQDKKFIEWARKKGAAKFFVSEATWATLRQQAEAQPPFKRQEWLNRVDQQVPQQFGARLIPVDRQVWEKWSTISGNMESGKEPPMDESIEIATALRHSLVYATKGSELAQAVRCPTENPWQPSP